MPIATEWCGQIEILFGAFFKDAYGKAVLNATFTISPREMTCFKRSFRTQWLAALDQYFA